MERAGEGSETVHVDRRPVGKELRSTLVKSPFASSPSTPGTPTAILRVEPSAIGFSPTADGLALSQFRCESLRTKGGAIARTRTGATTPATEGRRLRRLVCQVLFLTLLGPPGLGAQDRPSIEPHRYAEMRAYFLAHYQTPERYVVDKFDDHDVVLLGEFHRIRHDVELVQRLIPLLYQEGVRALGTEFARRVDQALVDSLLSQPEWDEELARTIQLRQFVAWGYREYVNVMRAAWSVNRALPDDAIPFRILALNNAPDWGQIRTQEDRDDPAVRRRVWHGETEEDWARPVLDYVEKGGKILLHMGFHHAFTRYRQPVVAEGQFVRFGDVRAGNVLHREMGDRVFLVYEHAVWPPREGYAGEYVRPADGFVDAFFANLPAGFERVGFDVRGTPFDGLPVETSVYSHGYSDLTLGDIVDGYIYHGPFCDYEPVTPIPGFINAENLEYARRNSVNPAFRTATAERYNEAVARSADLSVWCEQLQTGKKEGRP